MWVFFQWKAASNLQAGLNRTNAEKMHLKQAGRVEEEPEVTRQAAWTLIVLRFQTEQTFSSLHPDRKKG